MIANGVSTRKRRKNKQFTYICLQLWSKKLRIFLFAPSSLLRTVKTNWEKKKRFLLLFRFSYSKSWARGEMISTFKHTKEASRQIWKCLTSIYYRRNDNWPYWNDRILTYEHKTMNNSIHKWVIYKSHRVVVLVLHCSKWLVCKWHRVDAVRSMCAFYVLDGVCDSVCSSV